MKKIILNLLVILTLFTINGCSKTNSNNYQIDGISMIIKENTLTRTGANIIIYDNSNKNYTYGDDYILEKKVKGKWKNLDTKKKEVWWNAVGYEVDSDNKLELECNWEYLYGKLKNGTYRLVKTVDIDNKKISVEFIIDDNIK